MGIGLSGMVSGLDTDSIVKAMVSGQQQKITKVENKITLNKWTTEAWSGLNTKIYSFYTKFASKLRLQSSYMTRTAKSSNESVATATATSSAAVGSHKLQVKSLASSQYVTGKQLQVGIKDENGNFKTNTDTGELILEKANYSKNTKLVDMVAVEKSEQGDIKGVSVTEGTIITITGNKGTGNEKVTKLEVTKNTTIDDFLSACKKSGLTASFDTNQQRFFISSSQSGEEDAFSIETSELSGVAATVFGTITASIDTSALSTTENTAYEDAMSTLRKNVDIVDDVLDKIEEKNTANFDKTQKAVYDAINVVKNAVAKTEAVRLEDIKINEAIADAKGATTKVKYPSDSTESLSYTYDELYKKAEDTVKANNEAAALKAAKEAIAKVELPKGTDKKYAAVADVTKQKYDEAAADIKSAEEKTYKYEDKDELGNTTEVEVEMSEANIDTLLKKELISQEEANKLKNAYAVVNTWNYSTDSNDSTITVGTKYEAAYKDAKEAKEGTEVTGDDGTVTVVGGSLQKDIADEMFAIVKSDCRKAYDEAVEAETKQQLTSENNSLLEAVETNLRTASTAGITTVDNGLKALGLGEITGAATPETADAADEDKMVVVAASNAKFVLDGAQMTETSNNFTVNGLTLNLTKETAVGEEIQITVGKNVDAVYDVVKEAITEYNKLIEEMNKLYSADSARGYDPLTSEQKEAMSEDEIKNWEDKIKGSLLRRDNTLSALLSGMRTALSSSYKDEDSGKSYALSSFGIVTGTYTENGKLHIYGDEDDGLYASYENKLKKALEEDPDMVMNTLTSVFSKLYETMTEKCAKTEISSALTFYNDKQYNKLLKGYEKDLDTLEDRIKDLEDKYYKQFTAMETALSKLQNQQNSLASLLGQTMQ